jgi:hypothetical protein
VVKIIEEMIQASTTKSVITQSGKKNKKIIIPINR